jgi:glycosyltransferase involved in cell wall biosynthesis
VPRWLVRADLCVAPFRPAEHSASQGNFALDPLKVFEYLALGKPTITVDSGNLQALFQHEEHALLLPPSDRARWRSGIESLIANPEKAEAMATRGRQRVLERHTWAAHAAHLDQLFQELVQP